MQGANITNISNGTNTANTSNGVEKISALMDGELDVDEAARLIAYLAQNADRRQAWDAYHVIGDAMRGECSRMMPVAFSARFSQQLALEPTVLAPRQRTPNVQAYALAAAASVAAVAVVGWVSMTVLEQDEPQGTVARAPAATIVAAKALPPALVPAPMADAAAPEHMHEYMLAHQGISPSTAIQGVTPYIRTVSSAGSASGIR